MTRWRVTPETLNIIVDPTCQFKNVMGQLSDRVWCLQTLGTVGGARGRLVPNYGLLMLNQ